LKVRERGPEPATPPSAFWRDSRVQSCREPAGTRVIVLNEPVPSTCNDGTGESVPSGDGPVVNRQLAQ